MNFYKYLYYTIYRKSERANAAPEIPVLTAISFGQTNNILALFHIGLIFLNYNFDYKVHYFYITLQIVLYIVNYYYFQTTNKGEEILSQQKFCKKFFPYWDVLYIILSVFLFGFTFYLLKENIFR